MPQHSDDMASEQTHHASDLHCDELVQQRRPDIEDIFLEALELSYEDLIQGGGSLDAASVKERRLLKE